MSKLSAIRGTEPDPTERRRSRRAAGRAGSVATALVIAAGLASCTIDSGWNQNTLEPLPSDRVVELAAAEDCDALVDAARPALAAAVESSWPEDHSSWTDSLPWAESDEMAEGSSADASRAPGPPSTAAASGDAAASDQLLAGSGAGDGGAGDSAQVIGTNNQEQGVDEADLVKTDGRLLVSVVNGVLRVVQLDGSPAIDGTLDLSSRGATDLFLRGDSALVLGTSYGNGGYGPVYEGPTAADPGTMPGTIVDGPEVFSPTSPETTTVPDTTVPDTTVPDTTVPDTTVPDTTVPGTTSSSTTSSTSTTTTSTTAVPAPPRFTTSTTLTLVSLSDPTAPAITASADVEGELVTARDSDGRARVVVRSGATAMTELWSATSRDAAVRSVEQVSSDELLPRISSDGRIDTIGGCTDVMVASSPAVASDDWSPSPQLSTVTVLSVGDELSDLAPVSFQGTADTVYASPAALYIASASWDEAGPRTDVHRLGLSGDGPAAYTGSGRIPGTLVDQFALSDRDGMLRAVTTTQAVQTEPLREMEATADIAVAPTSEARLTVLDTDGTLDEVASLGGMGIGEQVQSVRFLDEIAYLVTFRQVDPLYAVDLSDPRAPRLLGELKIPGFSEYLHPIGDGLLLGVGRQVDPSSGMDEGLKISLFDLADPTRPVELDQIVLPGATSEVSNDHRAFLWDPNRDQAVIPAELTGCDQSGRCTGTPGGTALVVRAGRDGLSEIGRITHTPSAGWSLQPTRSVVVDDDLWTVSIAALGRSDADAPTGVQLLPF